MHTIRVTGRMAMLISGMAIAAVCGLAPMAAAATAGLPGRALDPPAEEPCPGGEPKPCGAPAQERESVDAGREEAKKAAATAEKDIAAAKERAEKCAPESKECMANLIGDGAEQHKGLDDTRQALEAFKPAPADNAAPAVAGACDAFAAALGPLVRGDASQLTGVCELMK
ncbi:hypothetical protein Ssi03_58900 [Sphaerisporangium siamense]|uniref:Uncharacterized protein n=1 Tax=Sphaerisporangium siamense TaxID=795645 RepID=A0A7W7D3N1_9ACTN|nr:hypothetical protein [Sphaerisporangium siamense]MBB4699720.1 hypothetical protein [Sphaerisporangium siamense]GII87900.1 hypothetical protein Ssi03_58900 [Sphaerisporangium siamense]